MNAHFIDTSVFVNILDVANMNEKHDLIMKELETLVYTKSEMLILPFATIIETGNHIAQNGDGRQRRAAAERFTKCLTKTVEGEAPWVYYGKQMTPEDIRLICADFTDFAMRKEGFGDLSIIRAYERFREETPAISRIRIWSLDQHLQVYDEIIHSVGTRN